MIIEFEELLATNPDEARLQRMDFCIETLFGHLALDEVDLLEKEYQKTETRILEIIDVHIKSCVVSDLNEDIEFKPVIFPPEIVPLLRRHDIFLGTIGFESNRWKILYMSKSYRTNTY